MKNRNLSSPILCAIVLSLPALPLRSQVSNATYSTPAPAAQPAPAAAATGSATVVPVAKHTIAYTVMAGDSLTKIAQKFNTTRKKLKALNNLTASTVKPGQIVLVPFTKSSKPSAITALAAKAKDSHEYLRAQPVQDFDIPASTFASCPVPIPSQDEETDSPAPVMKLVAPAGLAVQPVPESVTPAAPMPRVTDNVVAPNGPDKHFTKTAPGNLSGGLADGSTPATGSHSPQAFNPPAPKPPGRSLAEILGFSSPSRPSANDWGNRFIQEARVLGNQGIEYDEDWRPPGESQAWTMDCSNTTRYIYKVTTGIQLPRTASDQYYYLHLQGKAWDVPQASDGWADGNFLRRNLKPGDLLFWENTYRPERQPPITHVMIFLGVNDKGQWIMAGSQTSRGGEHNRRNGGPDIYVFRPDQPCGGYSTWLGLVHHRGRFCAFGRPLEADRSKLAVAAND